MIELNVTVDEVVVDDFTGKDILCGGFSLTRLSDGNTCHFQSLTEGAIDALAALTSSEAAYRMFVSSLERRLTEELAEAEELDQSSALLLAQQADVILDGSTQIDHKTYSTDVVERIAEYTVPGSGQTLLPVGTQVILLGEGDEWFDGKVGEVLDHRPNSIFAYDILLSDSRETIAAFANEVVRFPETATV